MNAAQFTEMSVYVADVIETDGGTAASVTMGEMADGSRRSYALIHMTDGHLEQEYRVTSPAQRNSPAWAANFKWDTQVRVGDNWITLVEPCDNDWILELEDAATTREP